MKKITKILCRVLPIVLLGLLTINSAFGLDWTNVTPSSEGNLKDGGVIGTVAGNVWSIVMVVVRILAVTAVVVAGVRYMLASANEKADIKKQLIILVLGSVLVFGATYLIQIIYDVTSDLTSGTGVTVS